MPRSTQVPNAEQGEQATLIDASALIALLGAEPAAREVKELLRSGQTAITTLNLAEAIDRLKRRYDLEIEQTQPVIEGLLTKALALLPLGAAQAWYAGKIRAAHYHRTRCPISLADAVLLASAQQGWRIASSDTHLLEVAVREGIQITVLPDSMGRRASIALGEPNR